MKAVSHILFQENQKTPPAHRKRGLKWRCRDSRYLIHSDTVWLENLFAGSVWGFFNKFEIKINLIESEVIG
jgi:hypothetical protein